MDNIKLYSFYTPSHTVLKEKWFLPSIKDDYELVIEEREQQVVSGNFMDRGWISTMVYKVDLILKAIKENENKIFIHSDVDVHFFKPTKDMILKAIEGKDMVIQLESSYKSTICPGFFAARGNKSNLKLWQYIRSNLVKYGDRNDQDLLNKLLLDKTTRFFLKMAKLFNISRNKVSRGNSFGIRWDYLPDVFFCPGFVLNKRWAPGMDFEVPENIVLHHANWTVGINNKLAQLEYVKNIVDKRKYTGQ